MKEMKVLENQLSVEFPKVFKEVKEYEALKRRHSSISVDVISLITNTKHLAEVNQEQIIKLAKVTPMIRVLYENQVINSQLKCL